MIGIIDSGIGGLTVVSALKQRFPDYDLIYFGDTAHAPYGNKSAGTVIQYVLKNVETLLSNGAKIIVMASNAASSVAVERARHRFDIPIFEVITPAVELALRTTRNFRVGVIGTTATISSGQYEKKIGEINAAARIYSIASPLLVPLVEEGWINKPVTAMIVKKYLQPLKVRQIDTLILGCNHYSLLKSTIQRKIGKRTHLINPASVVADKLAAYLQKHAGVSDIPQKNKTLRLMVSDLTPQIQKTAHFILKKKVDLEHIWL